LGYFVDRARGQTNKHSSLTKRAERSNEKGKHMKTSPFPKKIQPDPFSKLECLGGSNLHIGKIAHEKWGRLTLTPYSFIDFRALGGKGVCP